MNQRRDHFLPAAYIGRFSESTNETSRDRPVWVSDRQSGISKKSASAVAYVTGLYDLPNAQPSWLGNSIDLWAYESKLPAALRELNTKNVYDARLWIDNLVPFVAGLFSRGPDANGGENGEGRVMQFQEHLMPVMAAQWTVLHFPQATLPTSDRALAPTSTSVGTGYVIPITTSSALLLEYRAAAQVAHWNKGRWYVRIRHMQAGQADLDAVTDALAGFALSAVYGPTRESVEHLTPDRIGARNRVWPSYIVNEEACDLICHVYDYFRVYAALQTDPSGAQAAADQAASSVFADKWQLPVAVVSTHRERTRGCVYVDGTTLGVDMRLGLEMKRLRLALGDFVRGTFVIVPLAELARVHQNLGEACVQNAEGRANRTYIDHEMTVRRRIELPRRGQRSNTLPALYQRHRRVRRNNSGRR